jgi:HAD superfamily phosphatase
VSSAVSAEEIRWITPHAQELLPRVDTIIFDVDGVLLSVAHTIRRVNCQAPVEYLRHLPGWTAPDDLLISEEIERFKRAGGFNDDLELTDAVVLLYLYKAARYGSQDAAFLHALSPTIAEFTDAIAQRGGWLTAAEAIIHEYATPTEGNAIRQSYDRPLIHRFFQEIRGGDLCERLYGYRPCYFPGPGSLHNDLVLIDASLLPTDKQLAVLTGRTRTEAEIALEQTGITDRIPMETHVMTSDDGSHKPDPDGLRRLVERLDSRVALYIGDARDDLRTVLNYRRSLPQHSTLNTQHFPPVLSAQVLSGTVGTEAPTLFAEADILAADVNAVLRL